MESKSTALTWDDLKVGVEMPLLTYVADEKDVQTFKNAVGDHNPIYEDAALFGGQIAPATFTADDYVVAVQSANFATRALHAKIEQEFINPVRVGATLSVRARVVEKYSQGSREYVVFETLIKDERDLEIARSKNTWVRTA